MQDHHGTSSEVQVCENRADFLPPVMLLGVLLLTSAEWKFQAFFLSEVTRNGMSLCCK